MEKTNLIHALNVSLGLNEVSILLAEIIGYFGIIAMTYGAGKGLWMFITQILKGKSSYGAIRIDLGQHFALGLEFLIGKDIIESLVEPTWDDLGKLATIIILRTMITLFLEHELDHLHGETSIGKKRKSISLSLATGQKTR